MLFPETLFGWVISIGAAVLICLLLLPEDGGQPRPPPAEDAAAADAGAPTCRICYAGAEAGRLFSPCLCSGTMAHVHVSCLSEWRKQSVNPRSLYTCDACGYSYRLQRTAVADALQSERCVWLASTLFVGLLVAVGAAVPVPTELWLYDAARWSPRAELGEWWGGVGGDLLVRGAVLPAALGFAYEPLPLPRRPCPRLARCASAAGGPTPCTRPSP
eukprot:Transcript_24345.p2 GENE.Transcript_24345~~Transcript_24345.p2  ORF type:complete len:240 (-),score=39.95 Transcript_24345:247-894(-)